MLGSTVTFALITALAGHASAATCVVGRVYCGFTLLQGNDFGYWEQEMIRVNPSLPAGQRFDSTWRCARNDPDGGKLEFLQYCKATPGRACQPNNSGKCTGLNDCCAAA